MKGQLSSTMVWAYQLLVGYGCDVSKKRMNL
jgi:hypothetical protein